MICIVLRSAAFLTPKIRMLNEAISRPTTPVENTIEQYKRKMHNLFDVAIIKPAINAVGVAAQQDVLVSVITFFKVSSTYPNPIRDDYFII